ENSLADDYAYLAAVPTSVFYDAASRKLYSHPLLFHQDEMPSPSLEERSLNAYQSLEYFMTDWMGYCKGQLDHLVLINMPREKAATWKARNVSTISGSDIYETAATIALHDWSFADRAVIAVVGEAAEVQNTTEGTLTGTFPAGQRVQTAQFEVGQSNSLNPVFHPFTVPDGYKYVTADVWWDSIILGGFIAIPPGDPDVQLFCQQGGEWMQTAAVANWNILTGPREYAESYVYNTGNWRIGITDIPTEAPRIDLLGGLLTLQGSPLQALLSLRRGVTYNVDVAMYPGTEMDIPETPAAGSRHARFVLEWDDPSAHLGFSLIGPAGEEIVSARNATGSQQVIEVERLGGCLPGEHYRLCIFSMDDTATRSVDYRISYSWHTNYTQERNDYLTSASEGAILASTLNAPLLYVSPTATPGSTREALRKLGVKEVYVMDMGGHLETRTRTALRNVAGIRQHYTRPEEAYHAISEVTGKRDVIFSTTDPWTYWYAGKLQPGGELPGALFVGPAALIAAHHGSPLLLIDNHARLSSSVVWHNEFWRRHVSERFEYTPVVAEMYLTGRRVYDFLDAYGFDRDGMETMITVADQYDIGTPWDRVFVGKAKPGRIFGSPVDVSAWISRSTFYPALIFQNPALSSAGVSMVNGSVSTRKPTGVLRSPAANTLVIERPSQEENMVYPVLCSFVTHKHRFNERGGEYYGSVYQCADGLTPGYDYTFDPIDQGLGEKYLGVEGAIFPDMTETEVVPT
ncbi:MAG: hypothetical protein ACP5EK_05640, partial [Thermoplasmatota archaeon]